MKALRIGVNALYLIPGGVGGTEIYLRNLLAALAAIDASNEYFVFTNRETGADLTPVQANFHWVPQPVRATFRPARILWEQTGLPIAAARLRLDVMFNPGFTCPLISACPNVTVFHDLQHKRHPEYFRWFDLPFWKLLLWAAVRRSKKLIAVSAATRDDLGHFYGVDADVIHHGVAEAFFDIASERRPQDYFLCVSTLHPHKNLERLVRACASVDVPLVIVGMRGFHATQLEKLIADTGRRARVRLTGWIPRMELYEYFRGARAFVYPSTFEGFGMPVLEAMAAGVPVACSCIAPLKEVAGEAALFFDPLDEDAMRRALEGLRDDGALRERLAAWGTARAREFTWEAAARKTLAVLERR